jgi:Protein of unknown function (DUF4019)
VNAILRSFRRRALRAAAILCVGSLVAAVALAQDPRASGVQTAARDWLALVDRSDTQASWDAAGKKFQSAMPASGWAAALAEARAPLGATKSRTISTTEFRKKLPNYPEGDYAVIIYTTGYANKSVAQETVTLEREADGKWRVIGYFIR